MIDDLLISSAKMPNASNAKDMYNFQMIAQLFSKCSTDLLEDYVETREFETLHEVLLGIDRSRGTLKDYLATFENSSLLAETIDTPDSCGRTALAWAVEYGWSDAVRVLLQYGANPHQLRPSTRGKSPLLHLVIAGPASEHSASAFLEVIRLLLKAGVDINAVDHEGWTPLHVAASWNLREVVRELLRFGGSKLDLNARTNQGESALHLAYGGGFDKEVENLLLNNLPSSARPSDNVSESQMVEISKPDYGDSDAEHDSPVGQAGGGEQFHDALESR